MQADKPQTELEYLLVLDFEATCIQDKKPQPCPQIIQFPIIVIHLPTGKKLDVFHQYVKPKFNPQLTPFCTQLTGITQKMVNQGISIEQTLQKIDKWFNKLSYLKEGNFTVVTCGDWDLNNCLKNQAKHKKLYVHKYLRSYINIKKYCSKVLGIEKVGGMMHMLEILNIKHQGRHHSGIDDVNNICNICIELAHKHQAIFPKTEINQVRFYLPAQNIKPEIHYLLVLDFEATCIKNNKIYPCPQIIQFPVILVDTHQNKKIDTFHQYVRPTLNAQISEFCTQLTGITQEQVNKGITLQETLENFDKWLKSKQFLEKGNFCFITCGDWDICTCLRLQAKTKGLKLKGYFQKYLNIKNYFLKAVKPKAKVNGMMEMLHQLGLKHEGKHHSGIDDVTNICNICIELVSKYHAKFPKTQIKHIELSQ